MIGPVLTMTLTGLAADVRNNRWSRSAITRITAVLATASVS
jgi:hypothetical protein